MNSNQNHTETKTTTKENGYKIEKNVPVPEFRKVSKYPLLHLNVGDSFAAPVGEVKMVRSAITRLNRQTKHALKFMTRTVHGRGRSGKQIRTWRIA